MKSDLVQAIDLLKNESLTLAAVRGEDIIRSKERGVKPLLGLIDGGVSLCGFSAADKVVGKAAAFLYVLLSPRCIHAGVISRPALDVLCGHGIEVSFDTLAESIRNRTNTGFCPMESAVMQTNDPDEALVLIRKKRLLL